jgi:hypothetical protein
MNDQWIPGPPVKPPTWTVNPLPPSNDWNDTEGCSAVSGPAIVDGVIITGVPATVSSLYWQVSLNDGGAPPNFAINHLNGAGAVLGPALSISGADLSATFAGPVYLARDPVEPKEAVTLEYLEAHGAGVEEVPDNQTYGRTLGAWNPVVPASGGGYTGAVTLGAGGAVTSGALTFYGSALAYLPTLAQLQIGDGPAGQVPTADGSGNLTWTTPTTGGPYLPLSGGTITGSLTVNQVLTVQGSNSLVLNGPNGNQRAILGQTSTLTRWQLMLGDGTSEGLNNTGSNFSLTAYATAGGFLGNWLTIARADGSTTFNGSGVTIAGGLAVNGLLALASPNNLAIYGGNPGDVLSTNGSGILSWAAQTGGGGPSGPPVTISATPPSAASAGDLWWDSVGGQLYIWYTDANSSQWIIAVNTGSSGGGASISVGATPPVNPSVGALWWDAVGAQMYLWFNDGNSSQWVPTTNQMAGVSPASTTVLGGVKVDGTSIKAAADGTISTVLIPMGDNRLINGDMRIDQRNNGASGTAIASGYWIDRWLYFATQPGQFQCGRNLGPPGSFAPGFPYCLGFGSLSAYAPLAGDTFGFSQMIEADMVSDLQWGTANAQPVTLSFWAISTLNGTFSGSIRNAATTRSYPFSFSVPSSAVWTKIVITIPGDTAGAWVMSGNAGALSVAFDLGGSTTYRAPAGAWATGNFVGANGAISVCATNNASFYVTGVKLEVGSVATPYNRQSLAKSLADCQRYYYSGPNEYTSGWADAPLVIYDIRVLKQSMRVAPTITINANHYDNATDIGLGSSTTDDFLVVLTAATTANMAGAWYTYTADAEL